MSQAEALEIITQIQNCLRLPMLETLMHLQDNPEEMDERERRAFRIVMAGFRALLLPA